MSTIMVAPAALGPPESLRCEVDVPKLHRRRRRHQRRRGRSPGILPAASLGAVVLAVAAVLGWNLSGGHLLVMETPSMCPRVCVGALVAEHPLHGPLRVGELISFHVPNNNTDLHPRCFAHLSQRSHPDAGCGEPRPRPVAHHEIRHRREGGLHGLGAGLAAQGSAPFRCRRADLDPRPAVHQRGLSAVLRQRIDVGAHRTSFVVAPPPRAGDCHREHDHGAAPSALGERLGCQHRIVAGHVQRARGPSCSRRLHRDRAGERAAARPRPAQVAGGRFVAMVGVGHRRPRRNLASRRLSMACLVWGRGGAPPPPWTRGLRD